MMRRVLVALTVAMLLAACGREASVQLSEAGGEQTAAEGSSAGDASDADSADDADGSDGEAGDAEDRDGRAADGAVSSDPDTPVSSSDDDQPRATAEPRATSPRRPSSGASSPGSGGFSSPGGGSQPSQGIAVGEPNPNDPDGCPECTDSSEPPMSEPEPSPGPGQSYTLPRPGQENVRPRGWESAEVHADDRTIDLTYWSGVEPCYVLDRVEVREEAGRVVITLYEGSQPGFDGACTEQAVMKKTQVRLSAPLAGRALVDGAD